MAYTQTDLKADIADDLARSDLTTQIADAITKAIEYYKATRFYFNETRDATFTTVASQPRYSSSDDTDIPLFVTLDAVFITVGGQNRALSYIPPTEFEWLVDSSASSGEPTSYTYFDRQFGLYPIPGSAYTVRPMGHIEVAAPATDGETSNVWMTEAYELIRARAGKQVARRIIRNYQMAADFDAMEQDELSKLYAETSRRVGTGCIQATSF